MKLSNNITHNIVDFRTSRNPVFLINALVQIIIQGRLPELFYSCFLQLRSKPSRIAEHEPDSLKELLREPLLRQPQFSDLTRNDLINLYGEQLASIEALPSDFAGARRSSIVYDDSHEYCIIGEYSVDVHSSRIAFITKESCRIDDYYSSIRGVKHIHAVYKLTNSNMVLITTGDSTKLMDQWRIGGHSISFDKRIKKRFAGYSAIDEINGNLYFGSDFSSRPNCIETLDGKVFFFPPLAFNLFPLVFYSLSDRYLISINQDLRMKENHRRTLTIFDTHDEQFIYCDFLP